MRRRICCLVYIQDKVSNKEYYIFEVATLDGKTLTTLIVDFTYKVNHVEKSIKEGRNGLEINL